ncbi:MAG: sodium:solute symporter [Gemmatimonadota bacterium]
MRGLDVAVIVAYFAAVIVFGLLLAGRQRNASDYFLGHRGLPWWALMFSVVATETSALTVISVPGLAARGDLTFLQIAFGYLVGRIGVAYLLLPGYFEGTQDTAYQRLEHRFGPLARRVASGVFLFTRALADCVRIFATAIPLAIITHWSLPAGIIAIGVVTLVYTWVGGLRAVVWVDVIQLGVYLLGGIATLIVATQLAGGFEAFGHALETGKLRTVDFSFSFHKTYTLWGGLIGGALLSAASHGTDHLIVQRLLAARNLKDAQRALIGSGLFIILQFALFLLVGTSLWLAGADDSVMRSDAIYPTFIVTHLPPGIAGLAVGGILAAAMSSHASAVNSLASASTHDFYAPLTGRQDPERLLRVGRWLTLVWTVVLVAGAIAFGDQNTPVVQLALSIASLTYGALLGTYLLGGIWPRARQVDVIVALVVSIAVMSPIVLGAVIPHFPVHWFPGLAWPWYVPLGTAVTVAVGLGSSLFGGPAGRAAGRPQTPA